MSNSQSAGVEQLDVLVPLPLETTHLIQEWIEDLDAGMQDVAGVLGGIHKATKAGFTARQVASLRGIATERVGYLLHRVSNPGSLQGLHVDLLARLRPSLALIEGACQSLLEVNDDEKFEAGVDKFIAAWEISCAEVRHFASVIDAAKTRAVQKMESDPSGRTLLCPNCQGPLDPCDIGGLCCNCRAPKGKLYGLWIDFKTAPHLLKSDPHWPAIQHLSCEKFGHGKFDDTTLERVENWLLTEHFDNREAMLSAPTAQIADLLRLATQARQQNGKAKGEDESADPKAMRIPRAEKCAVLSYWYAATKLNCQPTDDVAYEYLREHGFDDEEQLNELTGYELPDLLATWKQQLSRGRKKMGESKYEKRPGRPTGRSIVREDEI